MAKNNKKFNTYFISHKGLFSKARQNKIAKVSDIFFLTNDNDANFKVLAKDKKDKLIIYDPDFAGWVVPDKLISGVKNVKAVFLGTTDQSYINLDLCEKKKVKVVNIPRYATDSVAEYAIFYMFACAKKIPLQLKNANKQDFSDKFLQLQVKDKKVGVVGLGNIGQKVADICYGIGMNVTYWDRNVKQVNYDYVPLKSLFEQSDVVFLTLQINDETKKLITDDLLKSMKSNCIFISCTGTKLFNGDLANKLIQDGKIFGYALEDADAQLENYAGNTMVTSEYGWFTKEAAKKRFEYWFGNIITFLSDATGIPQTQLLGKDTKIITDEPLYCNIRKAEIADIPSILSLYQGQGWQGDNNSVKKMADNYSKYINSDRYVWLVAEYRNKIIGTVQANINNAEAFDCMDFMVMDYLLVQKKYRRRKVGTQLIRRLFEICHERNLESLWLVSSQTRNISHKFYKYQNFDDVVQGFRKTFRKVPWVNGGK